ncbi:MAG: hypothetical protein ACYCYR_17340 [Desulfobulbaceae bacterium]
MVTRDNEPKGFQGWATIFKAKQKELFQIIEDKLFDKGTGNSPESPDYEHLEYWILRACYDSLHPDTSLHKKREEEKRALSEIVEKEYNINKAIETLLDYFKRYPAATEEIAGKWFPGTGTPPMLIGVE